MSDTIATIDSRDAFTDELTALIDAAEAGDMSVQGAYEVELTTTSAAYEIIVTPLDPHRH